MCNFRKFPIMAKGKPAIGGTVQPIIIQNKCLPIVYFFNFSLRRVSVIRLYAGKILIGYILLHSTAHFLHALAVLLQQSGAEGFSHSAAQATQSSAQSLQSAAANDEPLASNLAHRAHMSAQSRQSAIDFKLFLSFRLIQQVTQSSHSMAHARQASMQFLEFSILFFFIFFFFSTAVAQPSGSLLPDYFIFSLSIPSRILGICRAYPTSPQGALRMYRFLQLRSFHFLQMSF